MNLDKKPAILIVDDTPANLDILLEGLGDRYNISVAVDGKSALETLEEQVPDLMLLDIMMPGMDGYEVLYSMKKNSLWASIPVIFLTAMSEAADKTKGLRAGAVDYITKPFDMTEVQARLDTQLTLKEARDFLENQNEILEDRVRKRTEELQMTQDATITALASLAETRDNETGWHIKRTQNYIRILAEAVRRKGWYLRDLSDQTIDLLYKSAPLHDIGKVGIPDDILMKNGPLTAEEFETMKRHTLLGADSLKRAEKESPASTFLETARLIALTHHEKWDGSGYPQGLKGEAIPLAGRLMALADVYDALITRRVYKPPYTHEKAVAIITDSRGTHFEPILCDAFLEIHTDFLRIARSHNREGEISTV